MNGKPKAQRERPGRLKVCCAATRAARLSCIPRVVVQCAGASGRYGAAIYRQQQWAAGDLRQSHEAPRMGQQRNHSQSEEGTTGGRISRRNPQGAQAKQGELVRPDLADAGLVARDGYKAGWLHAERLSENRIRPSKNEVESALIASENEVEPPSTTSENEAMRGVLTTLSTSDSEEYLDVAIYTHESKGRGEHDTR